MAKKTAKKAAKAKGDKLPTTKTAKPMSQR
jgi:hypothetical protein